MSGSNANADMSLSQILESAAAAAAFAWSQVVSHAAPKVQQQLQVNRLEEAGAQQYFYKPCDIFYVVQDFFLDTQGMKFP